MSAPSFDVVVPSAGRDSLAELLQALASASGPRPGRIIAVADGVVSLRIRGDVHVLRSPRRGPAAARNVGWRASSADWIAFLDDDVVPDRDWFARLSDDLAALPDDVAGSQGLLRVPMPEDRRPTDWERNVRGLETAEWATADMCYRRSALGAVGGFDERFPRAYREDADIALRIRRAGFRLVHGGRTIAHPVRPADALVSVRLQAGNADDALMTALHGRRWREEAGAGPGRLGAHAATTGAAAIALGGLVAGRRRLAAAAALAWIVGTGELAWRRIAPGPRTSREVGAMVLTSALIPAAACSHRLAGAVRARRLVRQAGRPEAVLLDRDGTLIVDVPYNAAPERVRAMPGAAAAVARLRAARIPLGVVSNQSGVGLGLLTPNDVETVNRRVDELLGPFDRWAVCTHAPSERCACRKPRPGLVRRAAAELGVRPDRCAVIGDIGADVLAAQAAGARPILVPTPATRVEEIEAAPEVAATLNEAVDLLLGGRG